MSNIEVPQSTGIANIKKVNCCCNHLDKHNPTVDRQILIDLLRKFFTY